MSRLVAAFSSPPQWVLRAAHCVGFSAPDELDVVLGTADVANQTGAERIEVQAIQVHPEYQAVVRAVDAQVGGAPGAGMPPANPFGNVLIPGDIALLRLAQPSTQPLMTLATSELADAYLPGTTATVVGWGNRSVVDRDIPDVLQAAEVDIVDDASCSAIHGETVGEDHVCAGQARRKGCLQR